MDAHRRIRRAALALTLLAVAGGWVVPSQPLAPVAAPDNMTMAAGKIRANAKGLDRCQAPSHNQMEAFWTGTTWYWWGI